MSDDGRLLHVSKSALTRQLLQSAERDRGPASSLRKVSAALGVSVASGVALSSGVASAAGAAASAGSKAGGLAAAGAAAGSGAAVGAKVTTAAGTLGIAAKWLAVGALAGSAVSGGSQLVSSSSERRGSVAAPPPASAPARRPQTERTPAAVTRPPSLERAEPVTPTEPAQDGRVAEARSARSLPRERSGPLGARAAVVEDSPFSASPADDALARENGFIDAARAALREKHLSRATAMLDAYDASARVRVLDREALVLRIEVLLAHGERERARALTARFAELYPNDPHVTRLKARLAATSSTP